MCGKKEWLYATLWTGVLVMFLRGEKVNVVQYWWNIFIKLKGGQVIILQMDQWLKTKNISDVPGQISCCQCKNLVKDTDYEFTECQTPRKKFQSIHISPVSLYAFTKTLKSDVSEAQKVKWMSGLLHSTIHHVIWYSGCS